MIPIITKDYDDDYDDNNNDNNFSLSNYTQIAKFMGQHGAHLGPVGPGWAPCWFHEPCYQGRTLTSSLALRISSLSANHIWKTTSGPDLDENTIVEKQSAA